jgi:hypothetical protein
MHERAYMHAYTHETCYCLSHRVMPLNGVARIVPGSSLMPLLARTIVNKQVIASDPGSGKGGA